MDYRSQTFRKKFESAKSALKSDSHQDIVSLKFRGGAMPSDYSELIREHLQHEAGLSVSPVTGDFSGHAWMVSLDKTGQIIIVEHETGLEILYIAGSIASLIALIPIAASGWRNLRRRFGNGYAHREMDSVEIRTFDANGSLLEQNVQNFNIFLLSQAKSATENSASSIENLEKQISTLKKQLALKKKTLPKKIALPKRKERRPKNKG